MLILFHPRYPERNTKTRAIIALRRAICLVLVIAFIATNSDIAMADQFSPAKGSSTLRPTNRFEALTDTEEEKLLLERGFRETAEFLYVNKAICRAIAVNFTDADELIAWIQEDLKGSRFSEFDYTKIYREADSFFLPIKNKDTGADILMRYFKLSGDETSPYVIKLAWRGVASVGLEFLDARSGEPVTPASPKPIAKPQEPSPEEQPVPEYIHLKNGNYSLQDLRAMPRPEVVRLLMDGGMNANEASDVLISLGLVDRRPVDAGLLSNRATAYSQLISDIVNPEHRGLIGFYPAAGADASRFFLSTDADIGVFVSMASEFELGDSAIVANSMMEYARVKRDRGFGAGFMLTGAVWPYLLFELKSIGAADIDSKRDEGGVWHVTFQWNGRRREIIYLHNTDARDSSLVQKQLNTVSPVENGFADIHQKVNGQFDLYYECAADLLFKEDTGDPDQVDSYRTNIFTEKYSEYMQGVISMLNSNGWIIVNDYENYKFDEFRNKSVSLRRLLKPYAPYFISPRSWDMVGYGREMYIYRINKSAISWPVVVAIALAVTAAITALFFGHDIAQWISTIWSYLFAGSPAAFPGSKSIADAVDAVSVGFFASGLQRLGGTGKGDVVKKVIFGDEYEFPKDVYDKIRPATPADAEAIHALQQEFLGNTERVYAVDEYKKIAIDKKLDYEKLEYYLLVYEDGGVVKGYLLASYDEEMDLPTISLLEIVTRPEARHEGIGTCFFGRLAEEASGQRVLCIDVIAENIYSVKIARHFGLGCRQPNQDGTGLYRRELVRNQVVELPDTDAGAVQGADYRLSSPDSLYYEIREKYLPGEEPAINFKATTMDGKELSGVSISIEEDIVWIEDVHTAFSARRNGIATALIERAFQRARSLGKPKVLVYCKVDNPIGEFFYTDTATRFGLVMETWQPHDNREAVIFAYDLRSSLLSGNKSATTQADEWLRANARLLSINNSPRMSGALYMPFIFASSLSLTGKLILTGIIYIYACAHREEILNWLKVKSGKDKWYSQHLRNLSIFLEKILIDLSINRFGRYITRSFRRPLGLTIQEDDTFYDPFSDRGPSDAWVSEAIASIPDEDKLSLWDHPDSEEAKYLKALIAITRDIFGDNGQMPAMRKTLMGIRGSDGRTTIFDYKPQVIELLDLIQSSKVVLTKWRDKLTDISLPAVVVSDNGSYSYYAGKDPGVIYLAYDIFVPLWRQALGGMLFDDHAEEENMRVAISYILEAAALAARKADRAMPEPEVFGKLIAGAGRAGRSKLAERLDERFAHALQAIQLAREDAVKTAISASDPAQTQPGHRIEAILHDLLRHGDNLVSLYYAIRRNRLTTNFVHMLDEIKSTGSREHRYLADMVWDKFTDASLLRMRMDRSNVLAIATACVDFPSPGVFYAAIKHLAILDQEGCKDFSLALQHLDPAVKDRFFGVLEDLINIPPSDLGDKRDLAAAAFEVRHYLIKASMEEVRFAMNSPLTDSVAWIRQAYLIYPNMETLRIMLEESGYIGYSYQNILMAALIDLDDIYANRKLLRDIEYIVNDDADPLRAGAAAVLYRLLELKIISQIEKLKTNPGDDALELDIIKNTRRFFDMCLILNRPDEGVYYMDSLLEGISRAIQPFRTPGHVSDKLKEGLYRARFIIMQAEKNNMPSLLEGARMYLLYHSKRCPEDGPLVDELLEKIAFMKSRSWPDGDRPGTGDGRYGPFGGPASSIIVLVGSAALFTLYAAMEWYASPAAMGGAMAGMWMVPGIWIAASLIFTHAAVPAGGEEGQNTSADTYAGKVVVIGGSAFGWEAISRIVEDLPEHHPPIIISEHIPPSENDIAKDLIRRYPGKIIVCENGVNGNTADITLRPDTILIGKYVAVTGKDENGHPIVRAYQDMIHSFREDGGHQYMSIDRLFTSAADHFGNGATGVVVAGRFVEDGLEGSEAIAGRGGDLLVQDMPPSIISAIFPMLPETVMDRVAGAKKVAPADMVTGIMGCASKPLNIDEENVAPVRSIFADVKKNRLYRFVKDFVDSSDMSDRDKKNYLRLVFAMVASQPIRFGIQWAVRVLCVENLIYGFLPYPWNMIVGLFAIKMPLGSMIIFSFKLFTGIRVGWAFIFSLVPYLGAALSVPSQIVLYNKNPFKVWQVLDSRDELRRIWASWVNSSSVNFAKEAVGSESIEISSGKPSATLESILIFAGAGILYAIITMAAAHPAGQYAYANMGLMGLLILNAVISAHGGGAPGDPKSDSRDRVDMPESVGRLIDQIKGCIQASSCEYPVWLFGSSGVKGMDGATDIDLAVPSAIFNAKGYYPLKRKLLEEVFGMKDIGAAEMESNEHVQVVALADLRTSGHGWYPLRHKVVHRIEGNSALVVRKFKDLYRIAGEDERVDTTVHSVLELGVGNWPYLQDLLHDYPNAQVVGIDIYEPVVSGLREDLQARGLDGRVAVLEGDIASLGSIGDIGNRRFDLALMINPEVFTDIQKLYASMMASDTIGPDVQLMADPHKIAAILSDINDRLTGDGRLEIFMGNNWRKEYLPDELMCLLTRSGAVSKKFRTGEYFAKPTDGGILYMLKKEHVRKLIELLTGAPQSAQLDDLGGATGVDISGNTRGPGLPSPGYWFADTRFIPADRFNYYRSIGSLLPVENRRERCMYVASGSDISTAFLVSGGAREMIFVDKVPFEGKNSGANLNLEYYKTHFLQGKRRSTFVNYDEFDTTVGMRRYILWELEGMGLDGDTDTEFDSRLGAYRMTYKLRGESEKRSILYYEVEDAGDDRAYPDALLDHIRSNKIDSFIIKAPQGLTVPANIADIIIRSFDQGAVAILDGIRQPFSGDPRLAIIDEDTPGYGALLRGIRAMEARSGLPFGYADVNVFILQRSSASTNEPVVSGDAATITAATKPWLDKLTKRYDELTDELDRAYEVLRSEEKRRGRTDDRDGLRRRIAKFEKDLRHIARVLEANGAAVDSATSSVWQDPMAPVATAGHSGYTWSSGRPLYQELTYSEGTLVNRHHRMVSMVVNNLRRLIYPGSRVLEIGTGSGILTRALAESLPRNYGADFIATDISPQAVADAHENLSGFDNIEIRKGRSFDPIRKGEIFDVIIANPPWYVTRKPMKHAGVALVDEGRQTIGEIVGGAARHLSPEGRLFIIYPIKLVDVLQDLADSNQMEFRMADSYRTKGGGVGLYEFKAPAGIRTGTEPKVKTNVRDSDPDSSPLGMITVFLRPFQWMGFSPEVSARVSFIAEELFFSGLLLNFLPWFLAVSGFLDAGYSLAILFLASNILYGVSHKTLYKWHKDNTEGEIKERINEAGPATRLHKIGFIFLGSIFRITYLLPVVGPYIGPVFALLGHGIHNDFLAGRYGLPLGMSGSDKGPQSRRRTKTPPMIIDGPNNYGGKLRIDLSNSIVKDWVDRMNISHREERGGEYIDAMGEAYFVRRIVSARSDHGSMRQAIGELLRVRAGDARMIENIFAVLLSNDEDTLLSLMKELKGIQELNIGRSQLLVDIWREYGGDRLTWAARPDVGSDAINSTLLWSEYIERVLCLLCLQSDKVGRYSYDYSRKIHSQTFEDFFDSGMRERLIKLGYRLRGLSARRGAPVMEARDELRSLIGSVRDDLERQRGFLSARDAANDPGAMGEAGSLPIAGRHGLSPYFAWHIFRTRGGDLRLGTFRHGLEEMEFALDRLESFLVNPDGEAVSDAAAAFSEFDKECAGIIQLMRADLETGRYEDLIRHAASTVSLLGRIFSSPQLIAVREFIADKVQDCTGLTLFKVPFPDDFRDIALDAIEATEDAMAELRAISESDGLSTVAERYMSVIGGDAETGGSGPLQAGPATKTKIDRTPRNYEGEVIVIGASASGYQALQEIIDRLPAHHPPIIISEHIPPDIAHPQAEDFRVFARSSWRNIILCESGRSDTFYLQEDMIFVGSNIALGADDNGYPVIRTYSSLGELTRERGPYGSIDSLFLSAAEQFGRRATCVVLSGAGQDGQKGAAVIAENHGRVFVQDVARGSIYVPFMPRSITDAGIPSEVLPVESMAERIVTREQLGAGSGVSPDGPFPDLSYPDAPVHFTSSDHNILDAIEALRQEGVAHITQELIAERAEVSQSTVSKRRHANPAVKQAVDAATSSDQNILDAIEALRQEGVTNITQKLVAGRAGVAQQTVSKRKRLNPAIEQAMSSGSGVGLLQDEGLRLRQRMSTDGAVSIVIDEPKPPVAEMRSRRSPSERIVPDDASRMSTNGPFPDARIFAPEKPDLPAGITADLVRAEFDKMIAEYDMTGIFAEGLIDKDIVMDRIMAQSRLAAWDRDDLSGYMWRYIVPLTDEERRALLDRKAIDPDRLAIIEEADRILEVYLRHLEEKYNFNLPFGYLRLRDHTAFWPQGKLLRHYGASKALFDFTLNTVIASDSLPPKELLTVLIHEGIHLNGRGFRAEANGGMPFDEGVTEYLTLGAMGHVGMDPEYFNIWQKHTKPWKKKEVRVIKAICEYLESEANLIRGYFAGDINDIPVIPLSIARSVIDREEPVIYDGRSMRFATARKRIMAGVKENIPNNRLYIVINRDEKGRLHVARFEAGKSKRSPAIGRRAGPGVDLRQVESRDGVVSVVIDRPKPPVAEMRRELPPGLSALADEPEADSGSGQEHLPGSIVALARKSIIPEHKTTDGILTAVGKAEPLGVDELQTIKPSTSLVLPVPDIPPEELLYVKRLYDMAQEVRDGNVPGNRWTGLARRIFFGASFDSLAEKLADAILLCNDRKLCEILKRRFTRLQLTESCGGTGKDFDLKSLLSKAADIIAFRQYCATYNISRRVFLGLGAASVAVTMSDPPPEWNPTVEVFRSIPKAFRLHPCASSFFEGITLRLEELCEGLRRNDNPEVVRLFIAIIEGEYSKFALLQDFLAHPDSNTYDIPSPDQLSYLCTLFEGVLKRYPYLAIALDDYNTSHRYVDVYLNYEKYVGDGERKPYGPADLFLRPDDIAKDEKWMDELSANPATAGLMTRIRKENSNTTGVLRSIDARFKFLRWYNLLHRLRDRLSEFDTLRRTWEDRNHDAGVNKLLDNLLKEPPLYIRDTIARYVISIEDDGDIAHHPETTLSVEKDPVCPEIAASDLPRKIAIPEPGLPATGGTQMAMAPDPVRSFPGSSASDSSETLFNPRADVFEVSHGYAYSKGPEPQAPDRDDLMIIKELETDVPIFSLDPHKQLPPGFGSAESGWSSAGPVDSDLAHRWLKDSVEEGLAKDVIQGLHAAPINILVMGSGEEFKNDLENIGRIFPNAQRICFADIQLANLTAIQRFARDLPESIRKKIELYHTDFADMSILNSGSFDIILASRVFDENLWNRINWQFTLGSRAEPVVSYDEVGKILSEWSSETARILKEKGILITFFAHNISMTKSGFSKKRCLDSNGRPYAIVWSRHEEMLNAIGADAVPGASSAAQASSGEPTLPKNEPDVRGCIESDGLTPERRGEIIAAIRASARLPSVNESALIKAAISTLKDYLNIAFDLAHEDKQAISEKLQAIQDGLENGAVKVFPAREGVRATTEYILAAADDASIYFADDFCRPDAIICTKNLNAEMLLHEILSLITPETSHGEHKERYRSGIQRQIMGPENLFKIAVRFYIHKIFAGSEKDPYSHTYPMIDRPILSAAIQQHGGPLDFGSTIRLIKYPFDILDVRQDPPHPFTREELLSLRRTFFFIGACNAFFESMFILINNDPVSYGRDSKLIDECISQYKKHFVFTEGGLRQYVDHVGPRIGEMHDDGIDGMFKKQMHDSVQCASRLLLQSQAFAALLGEDRLMSIDIASWIPDHGQEWESKVKDSAKEIRRIKPAYHIDENARGLKVKVSPGLLHLALERILSNGFHEGVVGEEMVMIVERSNIPGRVAVKILVPGSIDPKKCEVNPRWSLQELFTLDYMRPEFNHHIGMPFTAQAILSMGGMIRVDNTIHEGNPHILFTIELPEAQTGEVGQGAGGGDKTKHASTGICPTVKEIRRGLPSGPASLFNGLVEKIAFIRYIFECIRGGILNLLQRQKTVAATNRVVPAAIKRGLPDYFPEWTRVISFKDDNGWGMSVGFSPAVYMTFAGDFSAYLETRDPEFFAQLRKICLRPSCLGIWPGLEHLGNTTDDWMIALGYIYAHAGNIVNGKRDDYYAESGLFPLRHMGIIDENLAKLLKYVMQFLEEAGLPGHTIGAVCSEVNTAAPPASVAKEIVKPGVQSPKYGKEETIPRTPNPVLRTQALPAGNNSQVDAEEVSPSGTFQETLDANIPVSEMLCVEKLFKIANDLMGGVRGEKGIFRFVTRIFSDIEFGYLAEELADIVTAHSDPMMREVLMRRFAKPHLFLRSENGTNCDAAYILCAARDVLISRSYRGTYRPSRRQFFAACGAGAIALNVTAPSQPAGTAIEASTPEIFPINPEASKFLGFMNWKLGNLNDGLRAGLNPYNIADLIESLDLEYDDLSTLRSYVKDASVLKMPTADQCSVICDLLEDVLMRYPYLASSLDYNVRNDYHAWKKMANPIERAKLFLDPEHISMDREWMDQLAAHPATSPLIAEIMDDSQDWKFYADEQLRRSIRARKRFSYWHYLFHSLRNNMLEFDKARSEWIHGHSNCAENLRLGSLLTKPPEYLTREYISAKLAVPIQDVPMMRDRVGKEVAGSHMLVDNKKSNQSCKPNEYENGEGRAVSMPVKGVSDNRRGKVDEDQAKIASTFVHGLKRRAYKVKEEAKQGSDVIIIAVETNGYIPPEQNAMIQPLLRELTQERLGKDFAKIGLDNVKFVQGSGEAFKVELLRVKSETGANAKNVIVLGTKGTVDILSGLDELKGETEEDGTFFAEMDTTNITGFQYIRLLEMLAIALKSAYGETVNQGSHPMVDIRYITKRFIRLIPKAEKVPSNDLPGIYKKQAETLQAA